MSKVLHKFFNNLWICKVCQALKNIPLKIFRGMLCYNFANFPWKLSRLKSSLSMAFKTSRFLAVQRGARSLPLGASPVKRPITILSGKTSS